MDNSKLSGHDLTSGRVNMSLYDFTLRNVVGVINMLASIVIKLVTLTMNIFVTTLLRE